MTTTPDNEPTGVCPECGDAPSTWCTGCAACSCANGHDEGCAVAPGRAADATGTRLETEAGR